MTQARLGVDTPSDPFEIASGFLCFDATAAVVENAKGPDDGSIMAHYR
ncbi:MAG TPA: hypothetical protein VFG35_10725 [Actinoplanes sp.]|nr:hypothetical protein [Actinoplanes sp.]